MGGAFFVPPAHGGSRALSSVRHTAPIRSVRAGDGLSGSHTPPSLQPVADLVACSRTPSRLGLLSSRFEEWMEQRRGRALQPCNF